jgi:ATPase subunit of ABC transporter with duplicated ATPase domains
MEGDLVRVSARLESLASALGQNPDRHDLLNEYDATLARLAAIAESSGRGPAVVAALGLGHLALDMPISNLSGGQ